MAKRSNRRVDERAPARSGRKAKPKPKPKAKSNRRVDPNQPDSPTKPLRERDPLEFKARNRTVLLLLVLALINAWIFVWRDDGSIDTFSAEAAVIGGEGRQGFADPLDDACAGDSVRIFAGLDDRLRLETRLGEGRTLRLALLELGVVGETIDEVEAAVRGTMDLGMLTGSGAPVRIAGDRDGGLQAIEIEVSEGHLVQACRSPSGLEVRNIQHPLRVDVAVISLTLPDDGSLLDALVEAGQTPELANLIAQTLAQDVDVDTDTRPGDRFQVLVEKRYLGKHFHRYGKLLAVRYTGHAGRIAFYRYAPKQGREGFFDQDGQSMRRELLRTPFAWHPIDTDARNTLAPAIEFIDGRMGAVYRRPLGAPIVAVADGVITTLDRQGEEGLVLEVELADRRRVRYANLLRTVGELEEGDTVRQGQVVALVGNSGKTPVPRLRLELVAPTGERLDPVALTERGKNRAARVGESIPKDQLQQFTEDTQSWRRAMRKAGE